MICPHLQGELQQQLAEYTAADWEGYRVMQLKVQALVSCNICKESAAPEGVFNDNTLDASRLFRSLVLVGGHMARLLRGCLPAIVPAQACSAQLCCKMQVPCF